MSPTMTEGGISSWKVKEGGSFAPGDVLLEMVRFALSGIWRGSELIRTISQETDKASMDVEAQDEGVLVKIVVRVFLSGARRRDVGL